MGKRVQLIRHTTGSADAFTGLQGEVTVDYTQSELRLHDGLTKGGIPVARADLANADAATSVLAGKMSASHVSRLETVETFKDGSPQLLESIDVTTGVTAVEFTTGFSSAFAAYRLEFVQFRISADSFLDGQVSIGSAWQTGSSYEFNGGLYSHFHLTDFANPVKQSGVLPYDAGAQGYVEVGQYNAAMPVHALVTGFFAYLNVAINESYQHFRAQVVAAGAVDGLRLTARSGTMTGKFKLYGIPY